MQQEIHSVFKIPQKVSFYNIASEASHVYYILKICLNFRAFFEIFFFFQTLLVKINVFVFQISLCKTFCCTSTMCATCVPSVSDTVDDTVAML